MPVTSLAGTNLCPQSADVGGGRSNADNMVAWTVVLASMVVLAVANFA